MRVPLVLSVLLLAGCTPEQQTVRTLAPTTQSSTQTQTVPTVTGMRLSEAKELLGAQGYQVTVEDATGQQRQILEPQNWVVEAQEPQGTSITLKVRKPSDGSKEPTTTGTVPNVVCNDLQSAQDTLQAAGFFVLTSEDATGKGRQQVIDRNWVVVSQSSPAGSTPDKSTTIKLGAVKYGEPTGASGCKS